MERLPLVSLYEVDGDVARNQLLIIKRTLYAASYVHGDLRDNNVMWDPSKN